VPRALALLGAAAAALVLASGVEAAAPQYILVSGPGLERPVLLASWAENHAFLLALSNAPRARSATARRLAARPKLRLGLFWGWAKKPRPTRQSQANQKGWFYPAWQAQPAVVDLLVNGVRVPRIAPARVLGILARHGVPTRLPAPPAPDPEQPAACTAAEVQSLVVRFLDAFNRGDLAELDGIFAREPFFEWYVTDAPGERMSLAASQDRPSLVPYFAARHALGERLTLRSFRFNGNSGAPGYGNFEYGLTRGADDLQPTPYYGKGAAFCYRDQPDVIFVWTMGRQPA
jgi:hypothetical protein